MYPEVDQYIKARLTPSACDYNVSSEDCPACQADDTAWDALRASSIPLVAWIAENCKDYKSEAREVLMSLPADMDELDALADTHGWCDAWRRFREQAERAGVLPAAKTAVPAESEVTA